MAPCAGEGALQSGVGCAVEETGGYRAQRRRTGDRQSAREHERTDEADLELTRPEMVNGHVEPERKYRQTGGDTQHGEHLTPRDPMTEHPCRQWHRKRESGRGESLHE